jgi:hypothetical protein
MFAGESLLMGFKYEKLRNEPILWDRRPAYLHIRHIGIASMNPKIYPSIPA